MHTDFDEEVTGLRSQVRKLRDVSFSFLKLIFKGEDLFYISEMTFSCAVICECLILCSLGVYDNDCIDIMEQNSTSEMVSWVRKGKNQ